MWKLNKEPNVPTMALKMECGHENGTGLWVETAQERRLSYCRYFAEMEQKIFTNLLL